MKKQVILFSLFTAFLYVILAGNASGPGTWSALELTGVTGTATCGLAGCHTSPAGASILTSVQLISGTTGTSTYTPGGSYFIRISGFNASTVTSLPRFGFQVSAVTASSANAGIMVEPVPFFTHTVTAGGINLVEHSTALSSTGGTGAPGSTYTLDIPWTAPPAGTGTVTLRGIVNGVNADATSFGDAWGAGSATVTEATSGVSPISGTLSMCVGGTTSLTDATPGGTWSSGSPGVAAIGATGIVTGLSAGTSFISYATGSGTATATVTVNPNPAGITGTPAVCPGGASPLANSTTGGTWTSSNTTIATISSTGMMTGITSGTANISYTLATGCYSLLVVTVNTVPAIAGTGTLCAGGTTTLSHTIPGGTWSSGAAAIATVGATGVVTGIATGTATISYTFGSSGCYASTVVTVIGHPTVTGSATVCVGLTTALTALPAGGTWTSLNTARATVGPSTGIVTGITSGTVTIKYKVVSACGTDSATWAMTVVPIVSCPTGVNIVTAAQEDGLHIFPNPNAGSFSLNISAGENEPVHVVVTDLSGRLVKELVLITNNKAEVQLYQPRGVYIVSATTMLHKYVAKMVVE